MKYVVVMLSIISLAIIVITLRELKGIFIPLAIAGFLVVSFSPLTKLFKRKTPKILSLLLSVFILLAIAFLFGTLLFASFDGFTLEFPRYEAKLTTILESQIIKWDLPITDVKAYLVNEVDWMGVVNKLSISKVLSNTMGTFVSFSIGLILTLVFFIFLMLERDEISDRISSALSERRNHNFHRVLKNIEKSIQHYIGRKTLISLITSGFGMLFISIFHIDFVIISGVLLFFLNYIPNVGSFVASFFPILICFLQYGFGWQLFAIATALTSIQFVMGNLVEPKVMGNALNLSPITILIALIFWSWVWGPVGMILAVPITSAISLMAKEIRQIRFLYLIMCSNVNKD
ncbi:MAG: AI-2E family transporter [Candidatus Zophobacter franzmannii]|nr:AI-2E family transporter [Candidatus Zophobacter franzmannii]